MSQLEQLKEVNLYNTAKVTVELMQKLAIYARINLVNFMINI